MVLGLILGTPARASLPKGRYQVVAVPANAARQQAVSRAVIWARATRALRLARRSYIRSSFGWCQRRLLTVEKESRVALRTQGDFETMKRINQWLGLCTAVRGDKREAAAVFDRAVRLPGPAPDPQVFPPAVMALYAEAGSANKASQCGPLETSGRVLKLLDGQEVQKGDKTAVGEHYAVWEGGAGLVTVDEHCRLVPSEPGAASLGQDGIVTYRELEDEAFARAVAVRAESAKLSFRHIGSGREFAYDRSEGGLTEVPLSSPSSASGSLFPAPPPREDGSLAGSVSSSKSSSVSNSKRVWYEQWWVWAAMGAVVVTAIAVPVAASGSDESQRRTFTLAF